jgi:hypothetical protein
MYEKVEQYTGEVVYPAKYDTIFGHIGYERVEIDLLKAGRIPASQTNLGKAVYTVIEYDQKSIVIDSVCSWVNITGLTLPKLYRFRIYTKDEFDNKSVPQEIALIPYTVEEKELLEIPAPRVEYLPDGITVRWLGGISSVMLDFYGLSYHYTDRDGVNRSGESKETRPVIVADNLAPGNEVTFKVDFNVVPILNDDSRILDTLTVSRSFTFNLPL